MTWFSEVENENLPSQEDALFCGVVYIIVPVEYSAFKMFVDVGNSLEWKLWIIPFSAKIKGVDIEYSWLISGYIVESISVISLIGSAVLSVVKKVDVADSLVVFWVISIEFSGIFSVENDESFWLLIVVKDRFISGVISDVRMDSTSVVSSFNDVFNSLCVDVIISVNIIKLISYCLIFSRNTKNYGMLWILVLENLFFPFENRLK